MKEEELIAAKIKIKKRVRRTILIFAFAVLGVEIFLYFFN
tara:strand:+ start:1955 stop:2074 length:120 start_codon:yes stop_codon:yes gene_type:complete